MFQSLIKQTIHSCMLETSKDLQMFVGTRFYSKFKLIRKLLSTCIPPPPKPIFIDPFAKVYLGWRNTEQTIHQSLSSYSNESSYVSIFWEEKKQPVITISI